MGLRRGEVRGVPVDDYDGAVPETASLYARDEGRVLREAREEKGWSQRRFAPRVGVERTTIQKIEAGKLLPSVALARRIEAELDQVVFGDPQPCGCGCGEMTFAKFLPGHAPKPGGPVKSRRDRIDGGAGARLREARIGRGLTQQELGAIVYCSGFTISSIETGKDDPGEALALALEDALAASGLFDFQPCPCGRCSTRTVGGKFARAHHFDEERLRSAGRANAGRKRPDLTEWLRRAHEETKHLVEEHQTAERLIDLEGVSAIVKTVSGRQGATKWCRRHGLEPARYVRSRAGPARPLYRASDVRDAVKRVTEELVASVGTRFGDDPNVAARWYFRRFGSTALYGRIHGREGAVHGDKGSPHGVKGAQGGIEQARLNPGPPRKSTPREQQKILQLSQEGRSSRQIAAEIFGDARLYKRVQRLLASHPLAGS